MKNMRKPLAVTAGLALALALCPVLSTPSVALADEVADSEAGEQVVATEDGVSEDVAQEGDGIEEEYVAQGTGNGCSLEWHLGNWWMSGAWHPIVDRNHNGFCDICWAPIAGGGCQPGQPDPDNPGGGDTEEPEEPETPEEPGGDTEEPEIPEEPGGETEEPENPGEGGGTETPEEPGGETEEPGDDTTDTEEPGGDVTVEVEEAAEVSTAGDTTTATQDEDASDEDVPATGDATMAVAGVGALGTSLAGVGALLKRRRS